MDERERKTHADVKEFGWHVILVPEDEQGPAFAYSVGLQKTFNHLEILVLGLEIKLMHRMVNGIGDRVKAGTRFLSGQRYQDILSDYDCLFAKVEEKYYRDYFGQAIDFYKGRDFQVLQCIWPDKNGLFPGDSEFPESLRPKQTLTVLTNTGASTATKISRSVFKGIWEGISKGREKPEQASGNTPQEIQSTPTHPHKFRQDEWPFQDADNTAAFTTTRVVHDKYPVLLVTHDEDGAWQILCGTTNSPKDALIVCLGCSFDRDRSIGELADLPLGWKARRESKDSPWKREQTSHHDT